MEYIYGAIFAWIFISFCFFILEAVGIIDCFMESKALWILFAPMIFLVIFICPISIYKETKLKISRQKFSELEKCNFIYKKIGKSIYLCRLYGSKKTSSYFISFYYSVLYKDKMINHRTWR